jgi:serine/threonine protein kinase
MDHLEIPNIEVQEEIGRGTFGYVYKALDKRR